MTTQADYRGIYVVRYSSGTGLRVESRDQKGELILDESWEDFQSLLKAGQILLWKVGEEEEKR